MRIRKSLFIVHHFLHFFDGLKNLFLPLTLNFELTTNKYPLTAKTVSCDFLEQ